MKERRVRFSDDTKSAAAGEQGLAAQGQDELDDNTSSVRSRGSSAGQYDDSDALEASCFDAEWSDEGRAEERWHFKFHKRSVLTFPFSLSSFSPSMLVHISLFFLVSFTCVLCKCVCCFVFLIFSFFFKSFLYSCLLYV